jgi:hypothetical protein
MKATDFLRQAHVELDELFAGVVHTWDRDSRRLVFLHLREALLTLATVEEAVIFPAAKRLPSPRAALIVDRGLDANARIRALVRTLGVLGVDDGDFDEGLDLLARVVGSKVEAEQEELVPLLGEHLGERRLERLGREIASCRVESARG